MKLKHIHLPEEFLEFVKSEKDRLNRIGFCYITEAEIIRQIIQYGEPRYRKVNKLQGKP